MTKRNLLLASLLLVFGLGVMAPAAMAQVTVLSVNSGPFTLRNNSIGDAGGVTYIGVSSGPGTIAQGETFTITYSLPIVGASLISAPNVEPIAWFCTNGDILYPGNAAAVPPVDVCDAFTFSAKGNQLVFQTPGGLSGWTSGEISIWGLRYNTVGLPPSTPVTATVSVGISAISPIGIGTTSSTVSSPVTVGVTSPYGSTVAASVSYASSVLACYGTGGADFAVDVAENWAGAWTSLTDEQTRAIFAPTDIYEVTNGSNIAVTFSGIPNGVTVYPYDYIDITGTGQTFVLDPLSPVSYTALAANSSVTFTFDITTTNPIELEAEELWFTVYTNGAIPEPTPPIMTASVTLSPMTPQPQPKYPAFTYATGVEEPSYPLNMVEFIACQTNLLFPYVTNYTSGSSGGALGNWDTGIVISNTSSDPFTPNFGGAIPTAGTCVVSVYSSTAATGGGLMPSVDAAPVATFTTPPVYTGGILPFMLSQTTAKGLGGGYAIASCNFLDGTGYAEIVDNAGIGNWGVMGSYLAYVIPTPYFSPRWLTSEYGEFAIVPFGYYDDGGVATKKGAMRQMRPPATK